MSYFISKPKFTQQNDLNFTEFTNYTTQASSPFQFASPDATPKQKKNKHLVVQRLDRKSIIGGVNLKSILKNVQSKLSLTDSSIHQQSYKRKYLSNFSNQKNSDMNINKVIDSIKNEKYIIPMSKEKNAENGLMDLLNQSISSHIKESSYQQLESDLADIKILKSAIDPILLNKNQKNKIFNLHLAKQLNSHVAKILFYISHLIVSEKYTPNYDMITLIQNIQYQSRRLKFHSLTLFFCFQMGYVLCQQKQYQRALEYYLRSMRLAVYLSDKYHQQLAIDKMGICQYYLGNIGQAEYYHKNIHKLPKYEQQIIKDQYSNEKQIQILLEQRSEHIYKKLRKNSHVKANQTELAYNKYQLNFQDCSFKENYPQQNLKNFKMQLKDMTRVACFRQKVLMIKKSMKKIQSIGHKRYIRAKPFEFKKSKFSSNKIFANQVLLTHRSFNRFEGQSNKKKYTFQSKRMYEMLEWLVNGGMKNTICLYKNVCCLKNIHIMNE